MAYSQEIVDKLSSFFATTGIHAPFEERAGVGLFTLRMKLSCRLQSAQMLVIVREDNFSTLAQIPLTGRGGIPHPGELQHAQRQL